MKTLRNHNTLKTITVGALATIACVAAGCTHSDNDPNAAPYGAASPSTAPVAATTPTINSVPSAPPIAINSHADASPVAPPDAGAAPGAAGPIMGGPMMGMGGSPTAPLTPTPDLDAKIAAAEKAGKKPDIAAAYTERGTFRMTDEKAGAKIKYRAALQDYRKALAADPSNSVAKQNKDEIEGIYKQMGRPIPE